MNFHINY